MGILDRLKKSKPAAPADATTSVKSVAASTSLKAADSKDAITKPADQGPKVKAEKSSTEKTTTLKNCILRPMITEKSSMSGTYQFMVAANTNRIEVAKAFTALYNKTPRKVNIMKVKGKSVRFGRQLGKRSSWKKAVVFLQAGETIDLYA